MVVTPSEQLTTFLRIQLRFMPPISIDGAFNGAGSVDVADFDADGDIDIVGAA